MMTPLTCGYEKSPVKTARMINLEKRENKRLFLAYHFLAVSYYTKT